MQAQNITGFSETVNLGDIRKILRSPMVVMRVMPEGNPRAYEGVKWRGVTLNSFNGKKWFNDNADRISVPAEAYQRFVIPPPDGWEHRPHHPLRYRVLRAALSTDVLFAAAEPRELSGVRLLSVDETGSLHNPQNLSVPFAYDVVSDTGAPSGAGTARAPPPSIPDEIRLVYLRLPHTIDPRVSELARTLTASAANNYDRAAAIQSYLRNNFQYTLDPPAIEPEDPVGSFLFRSKSGYCEYFAAAMAVMLRTLNVPSRLVNGFQTGSYNRIGKDFVVRARDAHSWVEVYFTGYGWIPFDPTPADPHPVLPGEWDDYVDTAALFWNEWIINYDFSHQVQLAREVEQDSRDFQQVFRRRFEQLQAPGNPHRLPHRRLADVAQGASPVDHACHPGRLDPDRQNRGAGGIALSPGLEIRPARLRVESARSHAHLSAPAQDVAEERLSKNPFPNPARVCLFLSQHPVGPRCDGVHETL